MNGEKQNKICTNRLILRKFDCNDFEKYFNILKQEEVSRWLGNGKRITQDDVKKIMERYDKHWKDNEYGVWAVTSLQTGEILGHCGLRVLEDIGETELLYAFSPKFWGEGYATEAGKAVIEFAVKNLKLHKLVALAYSDNKASCNVIKKLGFEYKGTQEHFGAVLSYFELLL